MSKTILVLAMVLGLEMLAMVWQVKFVCLPAAAPVRKAVPLHSVVALRRLLAVAQWPCLLVQVMLADRCRCRVVRHRSWPGVAQPVVTRSCQAVLVGSLWLQRSLRCRAAAARPGRAAM